jgi:rhodanese-related sulfurtransferase
LFGALARLFGAAPRAPNWIAPNWIDCAELRARLGQPAPPLVVDVRGPDEFDGPLGHIEGALNIPLPDFAAQHGAVAAAGRPVVFVCLTDKRSSAAAAQFAADGRREIYVLRGGMKAWREAG